MKLLLLSVCRFEWVLNPAVRHESCFVRQVDDAAIVGPKVDSRERSADRNETRRRVFRMDEVTASPDGTVFMKSDAIEGSVRFLRCLAALHPRSPVTPTSPDRICRDSRRTIGL